MVHEFRTYDDYPLALIEAQKKMDKIITVKN